MVSLEQVKLLETKVAKAIDFVKNLSEENVALRGKLDGYRRRIDELEVLVKAFKEDQSRIEAGIMSALDRLNQFEDAVERGLSENKGETAEATATGPSEPPTAASRSEADSDEAILAALEAEEAARAAAARSDSIPAAETIEETPRAASAEETPDDQGGELDIF